MTRILHLLKAAASKIAAYGNDTVPPLRYTHTHTRAPLDASVLTARGCVSVRVFAAGSNRFDLQTKKKKLEKKNRFAHSWSVQRFGIGVDADFRIIVE